MSRLEKRVEKLESHNSSSPNDGLIINGTRICVADDDPIVLWGWAHREPPGETINEYRKSIGLTPQNIPGWDEPRVLTD